MTPPTADIDAALDLLDWVPPAHLVIMRRAVGQLIQLAATARITGEAVNADPVRWTPIERAMLYVLFVTSDEYLAARMRTAPDAIH